MTIHLSLHLQSSSNFNISLQAKLDLGLPSLAWFNNSNSNANWLSISLNLSSSNRAYHSHCHNKKLLNKNRASKGEHRTYSLKCSRILQSLQRLIIIGCRAPRSPPDPINFSTRTISFLAKTVMPAANSEVDSSPQR